MRTLNINLTNNTSEKDWLHSLRQKQLHSFLQRGFPTRHEESWKYTDMSALEKQIAQGSSYSNNALSFSEKKFDVIPNSISMVFINGQWSASRSDLQLLPPGVVLCSLKEALNTHEEIIKPYLIQGYDSERHPFASLNTAFINDGIFIFIPKNTVVSPIIHCIFISTSENNTLTSTRNIIVASANSQISFVEEFFADVAENYFTNAVTHLHADENAKIHYHKIQMESSKATHVANVFMTQKKDSSITSFNLGMGAALAREDVTVSVQERGAECHLNGLYHLNHDAQHLDNHIYVDHIAEHGASTMFYKGILNKKSHAVFNGKVFVRPQAQQINAHQANHNLLLSPQAQINTKPELEIYANDVKCTHGATVGQLDAESLFYLQARGIEKESAVELLTQAFAEEVINKIENPTILQHVQQRVNHEIL